MARREGGDNTGWIVWPTHCENTCEGGMSVYAIVPEEADGGGWAGGDSFITCSPGIQPVASLPDVCLNDEVEQALWPLDDGEDALGGRARWSTPCLAMVCLGTSGGSWWDSDYWHATRADLTVTGRQLVDALAALYGREPLIVTFLDT